MRTLRRAKRRAVRHVKVVEIRKHSCEEVGCEGMSLHDGGSEDEGEGEGDDEASPGQNEAGVSEYGGVETTAVNSVTLVTSSSSIEDSDHALPVVPDSAHRCRFKPILSALRIHLDLVKQLQDTVDRPRSIPFPCPFVSLLDTSTLVLLPLQSLSSTRSLPLPSPPSVKKLVLLLVPPTHAPGTFRLADSVPAGVEEVVIYLWRRHAASLYESFGSESWARQMGARSWGPDKIWGHWCNFILSASPLGLELPDVPESENRRERQYTFIGTGGVDPIWVNPSNKPWPRLSREDSGLVDGQPSYDQVQKMFREGMRSCMRTKIRDRRLRYTGTTEVPEGEEEWDAAAEACVNSMRFLSREEYLAEGKWSGEFTRDEVMYHG